MPCRSPIADAQRYARAAARIVSFQRDRPRAQSPRDPHRPRRCLASGDGSQSARSRSARPPPITGAWRQPKHSSGRPEECFDPPAGGARGWNVEASARHCWPPAAPASCCLRSRTTRLRPGFSCLANEGTSPIGVAAGRRVIGAPANRAPAASATPQRCGIATAFTRPGCRLTTPLRAIEPTRPAPSTTADA
jgi:hypothetical protein